MHHLSPTGVAGVVLANGSMSSTQNGEDAIRRSLVEGVGGAPGVVDCIVALPGQLFYSTQIPVCLWFLARDRSNGIARNTKLRDRRNEILFIDARQLGHMVDRTRKEFSNDEILNIGRTYHAWRGEKKAGRYEDVPGLCKSASLEDIQAHGHILNPGRYVGSEDKVLDETPFKDRLALLKIELQGHFRDAETSTKTLTALLKSI